MGINSRLTVLLRWLKETKPDVVCLQELKATTGQFPDAALLKMGVIECCQKLNP